METILKFLQDLEKNNNREWFKANEKEYKEAKKEFENFVAKLIIEINKFDKSIGYIEPKDCIFRIFRDVRFGKNKDPYKNNFGAYIATNGRKSLTAGYYIHIQAGASFAGGGIYSPPSDILKKIRTEIFEDPSAFRDIINKPSFKMVFNEIYGEKLKTKPKGFDDFDDIDLIRHKHYAVIQNLNNTEILSEKIIERIIEIYKVQKPFNDYLNNSITN